ncbi:Polygalacturonase 1 beta-like protein 3 [Camellia lanceoleosa]|uniref:Polygalacturonase 1 beta-like protein 3 n=1 Tax=Camellia lanceoleosa TaxID=1840588 RepID=A0ACC0GCQ2_9ERIC|nr:Polygalacturonase 1 beta-like protein 3 [Camellia lanceoleosa]
MNYREKSNVDDDSFQSYANNSNSGIVKFKSYGQSFNKGIDKFNGYGKGSKLAKVKSKFGLALVFCFL